MFSEFFELGDKVEGKVSEVFFEEKDLVDNIKKIISKYSKE